MNNITIEELRDIFKRSIDESTNMNETVERTIQYIYLRGWNDALQSKLVNEYVSNIQKMQPKTGLWIRHDTGHSKYYTCSLCDCAAPCMETADNILWKLANYCPDCGAMMVNHNLRLIGGNFESEDEE